MKHLKEFVKSVPDYRRTDKGNYKYKLEDILLLVILGRLGKCITPLFRDFVGRRAF